ncbi:hypothetical protein ACH4MO_13760 [Streptomyces globisporus]|uniref:hypothetical protein n=1 Tax=Streptomyces globisporus TaxID=1908 RepID=UPI0037A7E58B
MSQRAKQLRLHVEDLLLLMNASKVRKASFEYGGYSVPLRVFDKAEPFMLGKVTHAEFQDAQVFTDVALADLATPLNFVGMNNVYAPENGEDVGVHRLDVVRRPLLPVKTMTRHVVAHRRLFINRGTGVGDTSIAYYGSNTGELGSWVHLQLGGPLHEVRPDGALFLAMGLGLQFNRDYLWHAHLKWPGAEAGVMIPTTPEGARSLFRLRDYEAGASRRKALIHWVSEHSRRLKKDTSEETRVWVREHTRGATKFKWQDMEGAIYPAAADLRRLSSESGAS